MYITQKSRKDKKHKWIELFGSLPTHPGCFCMITAKAVICSRMIKSIMEV